MRALRTYFDASRWRLLFAVGMGAVQMLVLVPIPFLVRYAFDRAIPGRDLRALVAIGVGMAALQWLSSVLAVRLRSLTLDIVKGVTRDVRGALIAKWFELPRSRYTAAEPAVLHDRIVHDAERIDLAVNAVLVQVLPAGVLVCCVLVILFWLSPILTLATLALLPVAIFVSHRVRRRLRAATKTFHATFERFSRGTWATLEATDLAKIEAAEPRVEDAQRRSAERLRADSLAFAVLQSVVANAHATLTMVIGGVILVVGGWLLTRGSLTLGELISFYGALAMLRSSGNFALASVPSIIEGRAAAERVDAALREAVAPVYTGTRAAAIAGGLTLEGVRFGYDTRPLLIDVRLQLEPGDVAGISGGSGTGKTTVAMLILGLYRPEQGRIAFDGVPLDELDVRGLRRQVGMMPQDPLILPDTVLNNITFGLGAAADVDARVAEAAALADVDEFVRTLPDGYASQLGPRGINLSGGQRQRIALARALVKRPRLLILDEPTNHLGTETVTRVLDALRRWPTPPTVVIISHDPELLATLPRVLHLAEGKLHARMRDQTDGTFAGQAAG